MKRSTTLVLGILVAAGLVASACGPTTPQFKIKYAEKRAVLESNGLKLVVIPDKSTPMVQVDVRYEVGTNEDPVGKSGVAHYVEHMMFQFKLFGEDGPALFSVLPQIATSLNAYTMPDRTHYQLAANKESLEKLIAVEALRMQAATTACESISEDEFARELDVVRNEIRRRYGTAEGLVLLTLMKELFDQSHPYARMSNDEELVRITKADVCTFMKEYYHPSRATVLVAGNVDPDEVGQLVTKHFGQIPRGNPKARKPVPPIQTKKRKVVTELATERPSVAIAWSLPPMTSDDFVKGRIAASSLSSRAARLADDWEFASGCGAFVLGANTRNGIGGPEAPVLLLQCELYKNKDIDTALGYMWKAARGAHRGLKYVELNNKEQIARAKANYILGLERLGTRTEEVANLMQFGKGVEFTGDGEYFINQLKNLDKTDADDFSSFVSKNLSKSKGLVFVFKSSETGLKSDRRAAGKLAASAEHYAHVDPLIDPKEAHQPLTYPLSAGILAKAERYSLSNGMQVVLLPYETMPLMMASASFAVGDVHESPKKAGLASLAGNFLNPPNGAEAMYRLGINQWSNVGSDHTSFFTNGINIYQSQMIEALERTIKVGSYSQRGIESWQKRMKDRFRLSSGIQSRKYSDEVKTALYGPEHPYTLNGSVTAKTYSKMGKDALEAFRRKHYSAKNGTIFVVGNFDVDVVKSSIARNFGSWDSGHGDKEVSEPGKGAGKRINIGVVGRDVANSTIRIFYPGPVGYDDDQGLRMLGSAMLHDRMSRMRTQLGSTYGIGAQWSPRLGPSSYGMGGIIESARAPESLKFMRDAVTDLVAGNNFDVDFVRARRVLMKQLLSQSTATDSIMRNLQQIVNSKRPLDARWKLIKQIATAKPADVLAILKTDLNPSKEIIAIMADKATIEKTFEFIGATDVKLYELPSE
ncbi:MAG: insulinase family protein [Myxococcales bacterium]|nr:insulinase family protein [Myxococcales bacterium]